MNIYIENTKKWISFLSQKKIFRGTHVLDEYLNFKKDAIITKFSKEKQMMKNINKNVLTYYFSNFKTVLQVHRLPFFILTAAALGIIFTGCECEEPTEPQNLLKVIWATTTFSEDRANTGTFTESITGTIEEGKLLTNTTFTQGTDYSVEGLPLGLTLSLTSTDDQTLQLSIETAEGFSAHAITDSTKFTLLINQLSKDAYDFELRFGDWIKGLRGVSVDIEPDILFEYINDVGEFSDEEGFNNTVILSISGGEFLEADETGDNYRIDSLPSGLTSNVLITSDTFKLTIEGQADSHDITNNTMASIVIMSNMVMSTSNFLYEVPQLDNLMDPFTFELRFGEEKVPPDSAFTASDLILREGAENLGRFPNLEISFAENSPWLFNASLSEITNHRFLSDIFLRTNKFKIRDYSYNVEAVSDKKLVVSIGNHFSVVSPLGSIPKTAKSKISGVFHLNTNAVRGFFYDVPTGTGDVVPTGGSYTWDVTFLFGDFITSELWGQRRNHKSVVFNNRLWVLGGSGYNGYNGHKDIWSRSATEIWTQETTNDVLERNRHTSVVFNNKIWILGGFDYVIRSPSGSYLNGVWSSTNGSNWTRTSAIGTNGRRLHSSVVFNNRIWVLGGEFGKDLGDAGAERRFLVPSIVTEDTVRSSLDGINWETRTGNFPARSSHTSVVFNNQIWVMGGTVTGGSKRKNLRNDVWSSADGVNWNLMTMDAGWSRRRDHTSVVFNNRIWVLGGLRSHSVASEAYLNDVWSSVNGIDWIRVTANADWFGRDGHATAVFDGQIWVMGGDYYFNDVWVSRDGANWSTANSLDYPDL